MISRCAKNKGHGEEWGSKLEFFLACAGFSAGITNAWRLSFNCYLNGGAAFLIPTLLMYILFTIPMLYMQMAIGQLTRLGPVKAILKLCPLLKGTGIAMVIMCCYYCIYNNVMLAWAIYYLFQSFSNPLPWKLCDNPWNTDTCISGHENSSINEQPSKISFEKEMNYNNYNWSSESLTDTRPAKEYFNYHVLQMTPILDGLGSMRWELVGCLWFAWVICYFCVFRSVKSIGKASYVTVTLPFLIMIIFLIRCLTLEGAINGIRLFLYPDWSKLTDVNVWYSAASENIFLLEFGMGIRATYSSYNRKDNNISIDTFAFALISLVMAILAGVIMFSCIGGLASILETDISDVMSHGSSVFFINFPTLFTHLPRSNAWSVMFFLMLICSYLNLQMAVVEVICTTLHDVDMLQKILKKVPKHYQKAVVALVVCFVCFLLGLPGVTQAGYRLLNLIYDFGLTIPIMCVLYFQVMAICFIYGANRLAREISFLSRYRPLYFFPFCWLFIAPFMIYSIFNYTYANFRILGEYYSGGQAIGYLTMFSSIIWIPIGIIHALVKNSGTCGQRFKKSLTPTFQPSYSKLTNRTEEVHVPGSTIELHDTIADPLLLPESDIEQISSA